MIIKKHSIFKWWNLKEKSIFSMSPVITAEEYDRWYFLVHRAYAHFFDNIDDI